MKTRQIFGPIKNFIISLKRIQ